MLLAVGNTDENEIYLDVGPGKVEYLLMLIVLVSLIMLVLQQSMDSLNIISDSYNNAFVSTAFQANNVDVIQARCK